MRRTLHSLPTLALLGLLVFTACRTAGPGARGTVVDRGIASWYGPGFHGNLTASGEPYDMDTLTAAHRTLPFGTVVEVRNRDNGRSVQVKINDRGPFVRGRIIDLSREAAGRIGMIGPGTARVELVAVGVEPIGGFTYTVQVGAFREPGRARELADRLRDEYPDVDVRPGEVWTRVQLGSFVFRAEAERVAARLARRGFAAIVVPTTRLDAGLHPDDPHAAPQPSAT